MGKYMSDKYFFVGEILQKLLYKKDLNSNKEI